MEHPKWPKKLCLQLPVTLDLDLFDDQPNFLAKGIVLRLDSLHREIISRPDLLSGSGFHSIHPNPPRGAPDPPSSAPTGSGFALIQTQASFQIGIHVWVLRPDLDFCLSTRTGSCLALIYAQASLLIWIFVWVLRLDLVYSDLCPSQLPDLDLCLSTRTRSRLAPLHARARCQIQIFVWVLGLVILQCTSA